MGKDSKETKNDKPEKIKKQKKTEDEKKTKHRNVKLENLQAKLKLQRAETCIGEIEKELIKSEDHTMTGGGIVMIKAIHKAIKDFEKYKKESDDVPVTPKKKKEKKEKNDKKSDDDAEKETPKKKKSSEKKDKE
jgi:hypothetical protein